MSDRSVKTLLVAIALLLVALLVRPSSVTPPAQAQAGPGAPVASSITASNNMVYVVKGDQMSVYYLDLGGDPFEALKLMGSDKEQEEFARKVKLRLLLRQDLNRLGAEPKKAP